MIKQQYFPKWYYRRPPANTRRVRHLVRYSGELQMVCNMTPAKMIRHELHNQILICGRNMCRGKIFLVKCSGSNVLGQIFGVKFSGSNVLGQMFWVKFSGSNFLGQMFWIKCSGSNFRGKIFGANVLGQMFLVKFSGSNFRGQISQSNFWGKFSWSNFRNFAKLCYSNFKKYFVKQCATVKHARKPC